VTSQDASRLTREAHELKAAGRLDEAIGRYGEALAANPQSGVAEHNLAAALGDAGRWADAEPHIRAAFARGVDAPETWLMLARCEQALLKLDASEKAFREAIRRRPGMPGAQRELAQLIWMRTGNLSAALADVEVGLRTAPANITLAMVKAQTLEFAGRVADAFAAMVDLAAANPGQPSLMVYASQLAASLGEGQEALNLAERAVPLAPQEMAVQVTLAEALLVAGRPERAADIAASIRRKWSTNQHAIALQATAWRMLCDRRYRQLYDYGAFVWSSLLDTPQGWPGLGAYIADVAAALKSLHAYREHPFNQSLRHGSQAVNILQQDHPALRALPQALEGPIKRRLAEIGRGEDPVRSRNTGDFSFQGMWSVRLRPGGYHINHVHPQGWLSSACYVEIVEPKDKEGWIKFGEPGLKTMPPLPPEHFVEPKPGLLVLFPSYMWHGTVPFTGDKSRLTFAFDIVPAPDKSSDED
jgi:tetratricopeptide (TPR) repeat protein